MGLDASDENILVGEASLVKSGASKLECLVEDKREKIWVGVLGLICCGF